MSRFGQYLVANDLISVEQLDDALGHQAVHGARLGTNLVELGSIAIEQLAQALSEFHKVPLPQRKWIEKPQRAATQRATRSLVERIRFIPMRLEGKVLHAALLDPRHPNVLDDLRFATGCRIQPYVMPEIWMHDWLWELFQLPRGIRHIETRRTSRRAPRRQSSDQPAHAQSVQLPRHSAPPEFESNAVPGTRTPVPASWNKPAAKPAAPNIWNTTPDTAAWTPLDLPPPSRPPPVTARERAASRPPPASLADAASVRPPPISLPPLPGKSAAQRSVPPPFNPQARAAAPAKDSHPLEQTSWSTITTTAALKSSAAAPAALPEPVAIIAPKPAAAAPAIVAPEPAAALEPAAAPEPILAPEPAREAPVFAEEPAAPAAAAQIEAATDTSAAPPIATAVTPHALQLARWEAEMLDASHRDRLIELALSIAGNFASRAALFTVHQGMVQAMRIVNGAVMPVDGMLLPLDTPCMLTEAVTRNEPMRAQAQDRPLDMQILDMIGDADSDGVALFPVAIKSRVVNVLFASNGLDPIGEIAFAALGRLAQQMGLAYGRLILSRKASGNS